MKVNCEGEVQRKGSVSSQLTRGEVRLLQIEVSLSGEMEDLEVRKLACISLRFVKLPHSL